MTRSAWSWRAVFGDAAGFETELDVLAHGEPRQEREGLEHHRGARVGSGHGLAAVGDRARWRGR